MHTSLQLKESPSWQQMVLFRYERSDPAARLSLQAIYHSSPSLSPPPNHWGDSGPPSSVPSFTCVQESVNLRSLGLFIQGVSGSEPACRVRRGSMGRFLMMCFSVKPKNTDWLKVHWKNPSGRLYVCRKKAFQCFKHVKISCIFLYFVTLQLNWKENYSWISNILPNKYWIIRKCFCFLFFQDDPLFTSINLSINSNQHSHSMRDATTIALGSRVEVDVQCLFFFIQHPKCFLCLLW